MHLHGGLCDFGYALFRTMFTGTETTLGVVKRMNKNEMCVGKKHSKVMDAEHPRVPTIPFVVILNIINC